MRSMVARHVIASHQQMMKRAADSEGQQTATVTTTTTRSVSGATLAIAAVCGLLGAFALGAATYYVYRLVKLRRERRNKMNQIHVSNKRVRRDTFGDDEIGIRKQEHWDADAASLSYTSTENLRLERPPQAVLARSVEYHDGRRSYDSNTNSSHSSWVPQVKNTTETAGASSTNLVTKPSLNKPSKLHTVTTYFDPGSLANSEIISMSPPPAYSIGSPGRGFGIGEQSASIDGLVGVVNLTNYIQVPRVVTPTVTVFASRALPSTPGTTNTPTGKFKAETDPTNNNYLTTPEPPSKRPLPLPSPIRSESFAAAQATTSVYSERYSRNGNDYEQDAISRPPSATATNSTQQNDLDPDLPRLMVVNMTYTPTMEDELHINVGENVRMLEEYKDGWCMIQYVGSYGETRGVVPRMCLVERGSIVVPRHMPSDSSFASSGFRL